MTEGTRETVHTRALQRAAVILGGMEQLRSHLRVPKDKLALWLIGVEALPPNVFLKVVDLVLEHDLPRMPGRPAASTQRKLQIRVGSHTARCPACDCVDFVPAAAGGVVTNTTVLTCGYCGFHVTRGELVVSASDDAAKRSAAAMNVLKKRQSAWRERSAADAKPQAEKKN